MRDRANYIEIWDELAAEKAMVFVAGPRQSGKTTLARLIAERYANVVYMNWDIPEHRLRLLEDSSFFTRVERRDGSLPLVILDEIHKHPDWKNYLKGVYDEFHGDFQFLVSGSGRLDTWQRGGDSLAGRYYLFHLWPFTLAELGDVRRDIKDFIADPLQVADGEEKLLEIWNGLAERSGFPEPCLSGKQRTYNRWSTTYSRQLVREDIRDLAGVRSVEQMETLYQLLPTKVGSPLSSTTLAGDLKASYNSVQSWVGLFERFFLTFSLSTWTNRLARALSKPRKVYLWDSPRVRDPAARFENLVALELKRAVSNWTELGHGEFSLHFVRDKDGREVDFLIARDREPMLLIEAKLTDRRPAPSLKRFQAMLKVPAVQLVGEGDTWQLLPNQDQKILITPAHLWLASLP